MEGSLPGLQRSKRMSIHILGIRHHGPGSARNVRQFLEELEPDIVLVEGPPEADSILQWVGHAELKPPVALLVYQPDNPDGSSFYPFAEFSPEWQAILYARKKNIHVRFMDLPATHRLTLKKNPATPATPATPAEHPEQPEHPQQPDQPKAAKAAEVDDKSQPTGQSESPDQPEAASQRQPANQPKAADPTDPAHLPKSPSQPQPANEAKAPDPTDPAEAADKSQPAGQSVPTDPITHLAAAAGHPDGEGWWEQMFEFRRANEDVFVAVQEAMTELRSAHPEEDPESQLREAHMRKTIRQTQKEMFDRIAVICGAWHVPALVDMPPQKEDNELLKGLNKVKVESTWVPWTYGRLSYTSGYGAGILSPGWYEHVWEHPSDDGTRWLAKVAALFRRQGMDTSVAHVIEAVRLAGSLAALRGLSKAGLTELNEATLSVLCNGEPLLLQLIHKELIVSNRIGEVPTEIPKPPLQVDIEKQQKRLRLPPTADFKDYTLDLRKETDLERSIFLHRLQLLEIKWGERSDVAGKGTFKEQWRLQWDPAFSIDIIEKGNQGNTVEEAAANYLIQKAREATALSEVCEQLENALPAELPKAVEILIQRINNLAAASADVVQLMEVIPGLVNVSRYGNVRKTDADLVTQIATSMIIRICVSLPPACTNVDDEAAAKLLELLFRLNESINLLQQAPITQEWQQTLRATASGTTIAPVIAGYATRLLTDYKLLAGDELVQRFNYAMSAATAPNIAAAWLEGFLKGSGTFLLLDQQLWSVVFSWVGGLGGESFTQVLPLLRRTFANYSNTERRKLGEKVRVGDSAAGSPASTAVDAGFDLERGAQGIPVIMQLLGLSTPTIVVNKETKTDE
jgi:hypothetical protein